MLIVTTRLEKTALLKLLDLYPFSFIYEIKTEEFTHLLTNQLIWISLNQGADSTWWGRTQKVWGRTWYEVGANSIGGESGGYRTGLQVHFFKKLPFSDFHNWKKFYSPHKPSLPPLTFTPKIFFKSHFFFNWSVGHQLATFFKILVAKYNFHLPLQPKWSQLGALLHVSIEGLG